MKYNGDFNLRVANLRSFVIFRAKTTIKLVLATRGAHLKELIRRYVVNSAHKTKLKLQKVRSKAYQLDVILLIM